MIATFRRFVPLALSILVGCSSSSGDPAKAPGAFLELAISSDLQIPGDLDVLEIEAASSASTPFFQTYSVPGEAVLPGTLSFVTTDGPTSAPMGSIAPRVAVLGGAGTYTITVRARHGATEVVTRSAKVALSSGVAKKLAIALEKKCLSVACGDGQTCLSGVCASNVVDVATLPSP